MTDKIVSLDEEKAKKLKAAQAKGTLGQALGLKVNSEGQIKANSLINIEKIIDYDPHLKNTFKFNLFTDEVDVAREDTALHFKKGQLLDRYIDQIASYIEEQAAYNHVLFDANRIRAAIGVIAMKHCYNPVTDYLDTCRANWDGQHRIDQVFKTYLGVIPTNVALSIARLFFIGAVAKAYRPSTKIDFVLDLVGGQGAGKTTFVKKVAPLGYYTDQFSSFENKDDFAVMRRALIINDDELTATHNSSFEVLKKFVTLQTFEYRKPYGHQAERFAKNFVMVRTTNEIYYLKDKTGERRFLPLKVNKDLQDKHPVTDLTQDYIDQLWGEAVAIYQSGKYSFALTKQQEEALDEHRREFMYTDEIEDLIYDALHGEFLGKTFLTAAEIGQQISPGIDLARNKKISNQIMNIMVNRFGWYKGRGYDENGKRCRGYIKHGTVLDTSGHEN